MFHILWQTIYRFPIKNFQFCKRVSCPQFCVICTMYFVSDVVCFPLQEYLEHRWLVRLLTLVSTGF